MKKTNRKGFTIVELVIVIAVIAILAAVLIPTFAGVTKKANESKALQEAKNSYSEDLALLDGQAGNYMKDKYTTPVYTVVATDATFNADETYYTKDAEVYTKATVEQSTFAPSTTTYYTITERKSITNGKFDGAKYTYENDKYTCIYENGTWDIDEKD